MWHWEDIVNFFKSENFAATVQPILMIVLMVIVFYFMLIRPQRKRDKAEKDMRSNIAVGDEVSTIGGFIGRIVSIKDDVLVIETSSDRTKLRVYRWAIRGKEAEPAESVEAPKEASDKSK